MVEFIAWTFEKDKIKKETKFNKWMCEKISQPPEGNEEISNNEKVEFSVIVKLYNWIPIWKKMHE